MDLFDRKQYTDFFDKEPAADWHEAEPWDIWQAFGEEVPDVIFTSPPCKGFSGLLPEKSAGSKKYQALNLLTIRGIDISLAACRDYGGELPSLLLLENVPRIMTRGKKILNQIKTVLKKYGYAVNDESHDCGEIGGLGQHRKRYLLIARQETKMPSFVYKPEIKPLKTIGEVIGHLPLPGDEERGGPMHRVPLLQRKTWERLAFIPAGGDWRDLEKVEFEKYRLEYQPRGGGSYGVQDWDEPGNTVTGQAKVNGSSGCAAVADPRTNFKRGTHVSIYRVSKYNECAPTVTGAMRPNNGSLCVGDPRLNDRENRHPGVYRIVQIDETAPCVTGTRFGSGAIAIADPRANDRNGERRSNGYSVRPWDGQAHTITGEDTLGSGAQSVSDPRLGCKPRSGSYGVQKWDEPATTVTGSGDVHSGSAAIADPRIPEQNERCVMVIIAEDGTWHRPLTTYELGALQGFPSHLPDGRPFQIEGCSDAKAREYVGNAVPPDAAQGMANVILMALVLSNVGVSFMFSHMDVWVRPEEEITDRQLVH
ncbi:DNA cytosine methyltransferase [Cohnella kolymensis]|uniref:DNA cytosine methyltransferase n=1 Tax=Cohnella kolymensis TaxID=1590652 RepID=UPI000AF3B327|nr:DNA cytosine methyltransferase [Cohnella kolymensis]